MNKITRREFLERSMLAATAASVPAVCVRGDEAEGLDVYNTILETMGASRRLGPADREMKAVDAIRA
jgi:hypothetical protein